jgi:ribosomal protein S18 acetylase RimI-like enzyme
LSPRWPRPPESDYTFPREARRRIRQRAFSRYRGGVTDPPRFLVRSVAADELGGRLLDQALWVFGGALGFSQRHGRVSSFADTLRRHAGYAGFIAFGAFNGARNRLVGFSYGYSSQPGLWWREQVAAPLTPEQRRDWFSDAFELAELHVHPSAQGNRLGSALHDRVVASHPHRTALLSVMHRSERARQLYDSRGWECLIEELRFPTEPQTPFSLLGLRLTR